MYEESTTINSNRQKLKTSHLMQQSSKSSNVIIGSLASNFNIYDAVHKLHIRILTSPYFIIA